MTKKVKLMGPITGEGNEEPAITVRNGKREQANGKRRQPGNGTKQ